MTTPHPTQEGASEWELVETHDSGSTYRMKLWNRIWLYRVIEAGSVTAVTVYEDEAGEADYDEDDDDA